MRVGIMGGTFDPIHIAHLIIAQEAWERLDLAHVVFIPTGDPWLRPEKPVSSGEKRLEMVRLATQDNPAFKVSDVEVRRPGPTYSVDTLEALRGLEWADDDRVFFIMGMDAVLDLPRWREPERLLEMCYPVVFLRPEYPASRLDSVKQALPALADRLTLLEGPAIEISSSDIRRRVAQGRSCRYLLSEAVRRYIAQHGLYRERKD